MKQVNHAIFWSKSSTPFYEAHQARNIIKHAKHAILRSTPSTPSTPFYEARQARKHAKFIEHASMQSTPTRKGHQARKHVKYVKYAITRACKHAI